MADPTNHTQDSTALTPVGEETRQADSTVRAHAVGSAVIGAVPVPPLVMAALLAMNLKMLYSLSRIYKVEFNRDLGRAAIFSFIGACGAGAIGGRVMWGLSTLVPVAGQLLQAVTVPLFAAGLTYGIGKIFTQHFASGGTFLDFKPEAVREHFYKEFREGTKVAEASGMDAGAAQPVTA
jgi:uncharacterized protein (DUF697 family)